MLSDAQDALTMCAILSGQVETSLYPSSSSRVDNQSEEDNVYEAAGNQIRSAIAAIGLRRYSMRRTNIKRSMDFVENYFMNSPDQEFRMSVRTSKTGMGRLWHEIKDHAVLQNNSICRQKISILQLAVALERFGSYGNGACLGRITRTYGISKGTALECNKRVITAVRAQKSKYIFWPDANRRRQISAVMSRERFDGCVGFVDGTTIPLYKRPGIDGEVYWDLKSRYSLDTQVVCDCDNRIIMVYSGCPGSMADASVFRRTNLSKEPARYLNNGEYLIGGKRESLITDSAYGLSNQMITPYKSPATNLPENQVFINALAKSRFRNEHTIGILKSRWTSLNELRIAINKREDVEHAVLWISTCCILHNILADLENDWEKMTLNTRSLDFSEVSQNVDSSRAAELRERIKENVLLVNSQRRTYPSRN